MRWQYTEQMALKVSYITLVFYRMQGDLSVTTCMARTVVNNFQSLKRHEGCLSHAYNNMLLSENSCGPYC